MTALTTPFGQTQTQARLLFPGVLACVAGIFFGDLLLYFAGRMVGRSIVRWRSVRRFLSEQKLDEASRWLSDRGAGVVMLSRFTPGLRLPTYVAAGLLKTRFWRRGLRTSWLMVGMR